MLIIVYYLIDIVHYFQVGVAVGFPDFMNTNLQMILVVTNTVPFNFW